MKPLQLPMVAVLVSAACGLARADVKVQEQILGPNVAAPDGWVAVGRHGGHVAIIAPKGSRTVVIFDGVEGPKFDRIALVGHRHTENNVNPGGEDQHILFSPDGTRMAYVGQDGADYVVMVDGKELGRSKRPVDMMVFSPGGKHLVYAVQSADPNASLFVDGHGGPAAAVGVVPLFSIDDAHYLYPFVNAATHQMNPFIDGKPASYSGHDFIFSGDGGHVLGIVSDKSGDSLLLDGKVVSKSPGATLELSAAPQGLHFAYIQHQPGGDVVMIDGKKIDGVDPQHNQVVFSPDGNHAAVMCGDLVTTGGHAWVIVDGKKQQPYELVKDGFFTPDSARFVYTAMSNLKFFLVVNGNEWDGHSRMEQFTSDSAGAHFAFVDGRNLIVDNKPVAPFSGDVVTGTPAFSPDGTHFAFVHDASRRLVMLDGVDFKGVAFAPFTQAAKPDYLVFSPDGKHLLCAATSSGTPGKAIKGIAMDGQMVPAMDNISRPAFTPDSQHVFWTANETGQRDSSHQAVFLDGKQVLTFQRSFDDLPGAWDVGSDGTLSLIALSDGSIKHFTIIPSPDTNIAGMLTQAAADIAAIPATPARGAARRGRPATPPAGRRGAAGN